MMCRIGIILLFSYCTLCLAQPYPNSHSNESSSQSYSFVNGSKLMIIPDTEAELLVVQAKGLVRENIPLRLLDTNKQLIIETIIKQGSTIAYFDMSTQYDGKYYVSYNQGNLTVFQEVEYLRKE